MKENLLGFLTGTYTLKNIELTYDSINFINCPVKEKLIELMQTLQLTFNLLHTFSDV